MENESGKGVKSLKKFMSDNTTVRLLDISQINTFERCHRLYQYVYKQGLKTSMGMGALFSNMIIHPLLARWYSVSKGTGFTTEAAVAKAYRAFASAVEANGSQGGGPEYSKDYAFMAINNYERSYPQDFVMYDVESAEEVYWMVVPDAPGFVFVSKPDLVLRQKADGALVTVDFKVSKYEFNRGLIPFDRQFLGQAITIGAKFMMKNFLYLNLRSGNVPIYREFVPIDKDLASEWKKELVATLKEFDLVNELDVWAKHAPGSCYPYPNITCNFIKFCSLGAARHKMIEVAEKVNNLEYLGL